MQRSVRYILFLSILFLAATDSLSAQSFIQLKGQVVDDKTGESLPYATVRLKEAPIGTITNLKGGFSFWVSSRYSKATIQVSSVGYHDFETPVAEFLSGEKQIIQLKEDVRMQPGVTVVSDKLLTGLQVLKKAVKRIPQNYINEQHSFEAYYRELLHENGAVIKYSDAAVTFDQTPYDGEDYDGSPLGGQHLVRTGSWLGGYKGIYRVRDRLHDHFGHRTAVDDKVLIHQSRASLNHTRENFRPSIESGPLATLSKDLVKYLRHFIYKRGYDDYRYTLAEIDLGNGDWDYLVRFSPKREPKTLEGDLNIVGGKIRKHIFNGSIQIDPETFVIKKLVYEVGPKFRPHICSLGMNDIIHYGYSVEVDYKQYDQRWQMSHVQRIDRFLLPDTTTKRTTPYEAASEIWVTRPAVDRKVSEAESFKNKNHNALFDHLAVYDAAFWTQYEAKVPQAVIGDSLKRFMEEDLSLESQFALQGERQLERNPPVAPKSENGSESKDVFSWMHQPAMKDQLATYRSEELAYSKDYFKPFQKLIYDLDLDFKVAKQKFIKPDTIGDRTYKNWAEFTDRRGLRKLLKGRKQYNIETIDLDAIPGGAKLTLIHLGDKKSHPLKKRPVILTITDVKQSGLQTPFDASIIPMLERGFIFAYAHLKDAENTNPDWFLKGSSNAKLKQLERLVNMVNTLKASEYGDSTEIFIRAKGSGASLVSLAMQANDDFCQGALLTSPLLDPVGLHKAGESGFGELTSNWGAARITRKMEEWQQISPYNQPLNAVPNNVAYFVDSAGPISWQSLKMLARLRANDTKPGTVILLEKDDQTNEETGVSRKQIAEYLLIFQWLENQRLAAIKGE